jgi:hypothetical protein
VNPVRISSSRCKHFLLQQVAFWVRQRKSIFPFTRFGGIRVWIRRGSRASRTFQKTRVIAKPMKSAAIPAFCQSIFKVFFDTVVSDTAVSTVRDPVRTSTPQSNGTSCFPGATIAKKYFKRSIIVKGGEQRHFPVCIAGTGG